MTAITLPAGFKYKAAFIAGRPRHRDDHFSFLHPKMDRANRVQVSVRYYIPCTDENNFAFQLRGQYRIVSGICHKVDRDVTNSIIIDKAVIPLTNVIEITAADENIFKKDEWAAC